MVKDSYEVLITALHKRCFVVALVQAYYTTSKTKNVKNGNSDSRK